MTERPILMSAPMVRALLDGRKTQTRRAVKFEGLLDFKRGTDGVWHFRTAGGVTAVRCPYGVPGDRLWVREACSAVERSDGEDMVFYAADDSLHPIENSPESATRWFDLFTYDSKRRPAGSLVPSIHMPRWASRITLNITDIRVERLNDCSEADALAEGIIEYEADHHEDGDPAEYAWDDERGRGAIFGSAHEAYADLWRSINGPGSWAANPWVWAVSFEVQA